MTVLAESLSREVSDAAERRLEVPKPAAMRTILLLTVGHTGKIGSELCRQLGARQEWLRTQGLDLYMIGRLNTREFLWCETGSQDIETVPRHPDDLAQILRRFLSLRTHARLFVDCTGGNTFVQHYPELLKHGIAIVTPNKLANCGSLKDYRTLHHLSRRHCAPYHYETTVGAALPVLSTLADLRTRGDRITRIEAVVSGTLSFVFTRVNNGERFSAAVREAHTRGFTEPHPAADLAGLDSGRKLLILMREAGLAWEPQRVVVESLVPEELGAASAEEFLAGLARYDADWSEKAEAAHQRSLRLVYLARFDGRSASVGVTHVASTDPFALLTSGENLFRIWTEHYHPTPLTISGPGAGPEVTAAGLVTDILKAAQRLVGT